MERIVAHFPAVPQPEGNTLAFKDYSPIPSANTALGDGTYIGPNMLRNKVRPALQQLAADGKDLSDRLVPSGNLAGKYLAFDAQGGPIAASGTGSATDAQLVSFGERPVTESLVRSFASYGIRNFDLSQQGTFDSRLAEMRDHAAELALSGKRLLIEADAEANYAHDGVLDFDGFSFDGRGASFKAMSSGGAQTIRVRGQNINLRNFTTLGAALERDSGPNINNGILLEGVNRFLVDNVHVSSVDDARGFAGAGLFVTGCTDGIIRASSVEKNWSDACHTTGGSKHIHWDHMTCRGFNGRGDDHFAVVSYLTVNGQEPPEDARGICENITFGTCVSIDSHARALAVVGGLDVLATGLRVYRSKAAAVLFTREDINAAGLEYTTYGVRNCKALNVYAEGCAHGITMGAIHMLGMGEALTDEIDGKTVVREVADCEVTAHVTGIGVSSDAAVKLEGNNVVRAKVRVAGTVGGASANTAIVRNSGTDCDVWCDFDKVPTGGNALVMIDAKGSHKVGGRIREAGGVGFANSDFYFQNDAAVKEVHVDGLDIASANAKLLDLNNFSSGKLTFGRIWRNGGLLPAANNVPIAFLNGWSALETFPLRVTRFTNGLVLMTGGVSRVDSPPVGAPLFILPVGCRPPEDVLLICSDGFVLKVLTNGSVITHVAGPGATAFVCNPATFLATQ